MAPPETHLYMSILQLLLHFKWTWVGLFTVADVYTEWVMQIVYPVFSQHGICFAFTESCSSFIIANNWGKIEKWWLELYDKAVNVLIFYGDSLSMIIFRWLLSLLKNKYVAQKTTGKVWILTTQMELKFFSNKKSWEMQDLHGAISMAIHSNELHGFKQFLKSRDPLGVAEDNFIRDFWSYAFDRTIPDSILGNMNMQNCTGEERLENLPEHNFEMMASHGYSLYNAVHALAHALHAMYSSNPKSRETIDGQRTTLKNQQFWEARTLLFEPDSWFIYCLLAGRFPNC